jgi:proton-dependent oligopeptide transporter, POT family
MRHAIKFPCDDRGSWFGQPRGLTILFLTQMWEAFSFYGMRAMLVYYLTKQLHTTQEHASFVYGLYTGFVYLTPLAGGVIADRWMSKHRAVVAGGLTMAVGHFMMAYEQTTYAGLCVIAIGNGLFLPSLASQIRSLYVTPDPRRGAAYNVYYVGVNLGAFLAPIVCGALAEIWGWSYGFAAAGVGMLAGLTIFVHGSKYLPKYTTVDESVRNSPTRRVTKRTVTQFALIIAIVVLFRGAYEQLGNTVALWTDDSVDRIAFSHLVIPMTWFQSLNPLFVFVLTPLVITHWEIQAKRGSAIAPLVKMAMGATAVGSAYLLLAMVAWYTEKSGTQVSWSWLVIFFFLLTAGELYILPVGLGLFAQIAPVNMEATAVAAWFSAAFAGNLLAGYLGSLWGRMTHAHFFELIAILAGCSGLFLMAIQRLLPDVVAVPAPSTAPASAAETGN